MAQRTATKGDLWAAARSLELAQSGYELMDQKRNILVHELMSLIDRAGKLKERIDGTFQEAYAALRLANIFMPGSESVAESIPADNSIRVRYRSVMGTELPMISAAPEDKELLPYGLAGTTSAMDEAYKKFIAVKVFILELAELENSIYRLAYAIKKAQKRANALSNIVIPGLNSDIILITASLEEKEREDFVRLKVIKSQKEKA